MCCKVDAVSAFGGGLKYIFVDTGIPITSRFHVFSYLEVYLFQLFVPAISFQLSFDSVSFAHTLILTKQSPVHSATNVFTCFGVFHHH